MQTIIAQLLYYRLIHTETTVIRQYLKAIGWLFFRTSFCYLKIINRQFCITLQISNYILHIVLTDHCFNYTQGFWYQTEHCLKPIGYWILVYTSRKGYLCYNANQGKWKVVFSTESSEKLTVILRLKIAKIFQLVTIHSLCRSEG